MRLAVERFEDDAGGKLKNCCEFCLANLEVRVEKL